jgi:PAS domain S-box-containing protein
MMRGGSGMRRRVPRLIALVLAFLLIIASGALAFEVLRGLRRATAQIQRTLQTMLVLKAVEDLAEEGARAQRIYRFFSDTRYLDDYRKAQQELPAKLMRLRGLVANDTEQSRRLEQLSALIDRDAAALAALAGPAQTGVDGGSMPAELAASVDLSIAIVATVDGMLKSEQSLFQERIAVINSRDTVMLGTLLVSTVGSVGLIGVVFVLMRRDARRSEQLADAHSGALLDSELRFRHIFEESPLGMLLAEQDGERIVQANPAFCRMLGYGAGEMVGRTLPGVTHVDDRDALIGVLSRTAGPDESIETRFVTQSGLLAWARVRLTRLSASDRRQALLLALTEDITREKQAEAVLLQAQKMEAIGQLTGGIAHDFNNLLGVIIGNVEFLLDALEDRPDESSLAKEILSSALSGADLTRRLLAVARRQALQPRRIDLNAYLPNHLAILRRVLGDTIEVKANLASNLWLTRADPSQVGDGLLNLAINARDAMPNGGRILIETANAHVDAAMAAQHADRLPGDYVVLSVTDTGTGMPPELLERILEPFFTTKPPGAGSGLGLSMVYGFVRQSGGLLTIDSEPGRGTKVCLYLPRMLGEEADDREPDDVRSMPQGHEAILLVDDNAELRALGRRHLVDLGYRVTEAENGPVALELLQAEDRFDLLFTDIAMPNGMTGYQLAASAQTLRPGLKVLFTTGFTGPDVELEACCSPPGAMIRKPFRKHELAFAVRAVLEA